MGQDLFYATHHIGSTTILTYDLSKPVLNVEASYNNTDQGSWTVIVQCPGPNGAEAFGVIPKASADEEILKRAKDGDFKPLLVECGSKKTASP